LYTPLDEWEQRSPRLEDIRLSAELIEHLNANLEYYHHAIWWTMDPNRRYMLLDGYVAPNAGGRSVASVVDNSLIGIVGNSLVMPVALGNHLDPQFRLADGVTLLEQYDPQSPAPPSRISLPTRGVFAEAVMGDCNACEEVDDTRFWRWDEVPIDEPPALDVAALASRRSEPAYGSATPFPTPIVGMQTPQQAPEAAGVKAALDALAKSAFTDITGLTGTQANALAAYSKAMDTALAFGKEASELAKQASATKNVGQAMKAVEKAEQEGKIDKTESKPLYKSILEQVAGVPGQTAEDETKKKESDAATEVMGKVPPEQVESIETKTTKMTSKPSETPTGTTPVRPKPGAAQTINVQLLANYSDGQPIAADVRLVFVGQGRTVAFEQSTILGPLEGVAQGFVSLQPGSWVIGGSILIQRLPSNFMRSIPVTMEDGTVTNIDIANFIVSNADWTPLNGSAIVYASTRTLDLQLTAVLSQTTIKQSFDLTSATELGADAEINAKLKPSVAKVIKMGEIGGKIGVNGKKTWGTDKKFEFEVSYSHIEHFTVGERKP
jgi:hypothetical protein